MCSVFSLKFWWKKKGYFFVSGPEGDKNPSCIEIYVQKVGAEKLRKLRGNLLDFAAKNIEGFWINDFLTIFIDNTINMWYDTISDNKVGSTNIFVWL